MIDDDSDSDVRGPGVNEADLEAAADDLWGSRRKVTNFFKKAQQVSSDIKAAKPLHIFLVSTGMAIHLNFDASIRHISVDVVTEKFSLPDLQGALADYVNERVAQVCQPSTSWKDLTVQYLMHLCHLMTSGSGSKSVYSRHHTMANQLILLSQ